MKRILILAGIVMLLSSCMLSLTSKFDRLADKVEADGTKMSLEQWEKCNQQFQALVDEYIDNYSSLDSSEKKQINKAIGRYSKAAVKSGISGVADVAGSIVSELPDALDGLVESAQGLLEGLGL